MCLTSAQLAALAHFSASAQAQIQEATQDIQDILYLSNTSAATYTAALKHIREKAHIALHFHPDRIDSEGNTVTQSLLKSGLYKNQFETGISAGSLSAIPGGHRDRWEKSLFGNSYHTATFSPAERPKYGALDFALSADGPSPRFGSCYFFLKPAVLSRTTFTYLDSHTLPNEKGTIDCFEPVMAGLLKDIFFRGMALGKTDAKVGSFLKNLCQVYSSPGTPTSTHNLDVYMEAQVHGTVQLQTDVHALVADPSFRQTPIGDALENLALRYGFTLNWHQGFWLESTEVPDDFRGPRMPLVAQKVAEDDIITAYILGKAAQSLVQNPRAWVQLGTEKDLLQELKYLWHVLVRFGKPLSEMLK